MSRIAWALAAALPVALAVATDARAAVPCRSSGPFEPWLDRVKQDAIAQGISRAAIAQAQPYLVYEQRIVNIDRSQRVFAQSFLEFSGRMVSGGRISAGIAQMKKHAATFARAEQQYGVPPPVVAAFWGLESDFGANMGKDHPLRAVVTLAYDCRRADLRSVADVIGSTANYAASLGWKRGEPWLQEIRVPQSLPWQETGLDVQHPRAQWARWGANLADGRPLPNDNLPASVLLPQGRFGPAFLAYRNFQVYLQWNN